MAETKAGQADAIVARPDTAFRVFLVYGPDSGLVSERAETLSGKFGVNLSDPFALVRLDADAAADQGRLADEAATIAMFGGPRLIRIAGTTRRNLADALKPVLQVPPLDCWIIIEAGDLKKDSGLRRMVEKSAIAMAIPCYPDGDPEIERLISDEMHAASMTIDAEARLLLKSSLGGDRRISRSEIVKLLLYCMGRNSVTAADVGAVIGDTSAIDANEVIDAATTGNIAVLENRLVRLAASGFSADMLMLAGLRHFQALQLTKYRVEFTNMPLQAAISAIRPPLHFSRKDAFARALGLWSSRAIARAIARLDQASLDTRANAAVAIALAATALLAIALEASRASRR